MGNEKRKLRWVKLDNAAKIYPAAMRKNWSNLYRISVNLREDVDVEVLQNALEVLVKRFPSIAARLRKGAFWYYLEQVAEAPKIREEYSYPMVFMDKEELGQCALRVIAYKKRIAVEFFHSLTDGTGGLIFVKNLVAEYLEQKYGISVPCEHGIVDRNATPREEELEDCFPRFAGPITASRKDTNAWHMYGTEETNGFCHVTCFKIPVEAALAAAHAHGATLTVFMNAVMMQALWNLQKEKTAPGKPMKRIKVLIPINLRNLFPCETLRNFSMYTIPEIDPRLGEYSFREICQVIAHKMGTEFTAKHMSRVIATNVNDERNPLVRMIPLPIKNMVMKAVFDRVGEKKACLNMSNMGQVKVPEIMESYLERVDFILGVQASAPYNVGMTSFGDTAYINIIRNIQEPELERHFFGVLQQHKIPVTVESNQPGGEQTCIV